MCRFKINVKKKKNRLHLLIPVTVLQVDRKRYECVRQGECLFSVMLHTVICILSFANIIISGDDPVYVLLPSLKERKVWYGK